MNYRKIALAAAVLASLAALATPVMAAPGDPANPGPTASPVVASPSPSPIPVTGTPVLVAVAHPDDETLALAVPLAEHSGQNVTVLILTSGGASGAIDIVNHDLANENTAPLTVEEFMAAREAEAVAAVAVLNPTAQVRFAHLADGALTTASAKAAILAQADTLSLGAVRLKGHTYISAVEPHADHRAVGNAILELGNQFPTRFGDRRYYILPHSWGYTGTLPGKGWDYPANADVTARVHAASEVYGTWNPPYSYAIGHLSVPGLFATLDASPKSLVHQ